MLSVSMVQSHPLIPVMEKEFGDVPLHSDRIGGESYIDLFVQGEKAMRFESMVSSYDHVMRGDLLTVKLKSEEMSTVSGIMDRILGIGTVLPRSLYLTGGKIRAEYRFHASDLHNVTMLAGDILQMRNGMEIVGLGPDSGGHSVKLKNYYIYSKWIIIDKFSLLQVHTGRDCSPVPQKLCRYFRF